MLDISGLTYANIGPIDTGNLELLFGELLSVNYGGDGVVVVKGKITPSYNNEATIHQNFFSVEDLVKKHGFDSCSELQYWAVADMQSGDESKVISFTLSSEVIKALRDDQIAAIQLADYVTDLWILPSLREGVEGLSASAGVSDVAPIAANVAGAAAGDVTDGYTSPPAATSPPMPTSPPVTAPPQQQTEQLVWIPTKGGSKYHSKSTCSGMDGPIQVTVSEAKEKGFEPCGKCY